ncbi:hypothetical protein GCM10009841_25050 [Microlunatus panaciterrae]
MKIQKARVASFIRRGRRGVVRTADASRVAVELLIDSAEETVELGLDGGFRLLQVGVDVTVLADDGRGRIRVGR